MEISLGIIGTAGRKEDAQKLSLSSFKAMCVVASELIKQLGDSNYKITHLVSGGAAWADHVAVRLFLDKKVPNLRLFLPCDFEDGQFYNTLKGTALSFEVAGVINSYHRNFQRTTNTNSLSEIYISSCEGAELLPCRGGFFGRNAMIAKSDILLAMTFGIGNVVKEGGTADTVRKYLLKVDKEGCFNKSFHYNLTEGKIYIGVAAPTKIEKQKITLL